MNLQSSPAHKNLSRYNLTGHYYNIKNASLSATRPFGYPSFANSQSPRKHNSLRQMRMYHSFENGSWAFLRHVNAPGSKVGKNHRIFYQETANMRAVGITCRPSRSIKRWKEGRLVYLENSSFPGCKVDAKANISTVDHAAKTINPRCQKYLSTPESVNYPKITACQKARNIKKWYAVRLPGACTHPLAEKLSASMANSEESFHVRMAQELAWTQDRSNIEVKIFIDKTIVCQEQFEKDKSTAFPFCAEESKLFHAFEELEAEMSYIKADVVSSWNELENIDMAVFELAEKAKHRLSPVDQPWLNNAQNALELNGRDWIKQIASTEKAQFYPPTG